MPRRKKKPQELTTDEAIRKLFPKKVVEQVKKDVGSDSETSIKKNDSRDSTLCQVYNYEYIERCDALYTACQEEQTRRIT